MGQLKTLIHLHTTYSYDSDISPENLVRFAEDNDFGCVAVTDHDSIEGALHVRSLTDIKVIVGEEITTRDGHLIGLFLQERIRPYMSARETALAIKEQGGLVFVPHPFNKVFGCGLGPVTWQILDLIDAVEIGNAQNLLPFPDGLARRLASKTGLTTYVGADSHRRDSIGPCYQVMRDFDGPEDFARALAFATLIAGKHPLSYFARVGSALLCHLMHRPVAALARLGERVHGMTAARG